MARPDIEPLLGWVVGLYGVVYGTQHVVWSRATVYHLGPWQVATTTGIPVLRSVITVRGGSAHMRYATLDSTLITNPMIVATKKNEKMACSSVRRRIRAPTMDISVVPKHIAIVKEKYMKSQRSGADWLGKRKSGSLRPSALS